MNGNGAGTSDQPNKLVARKGPNAKRPRVAVAPLVQPQPLQPVAVNPAFANAPVFDAPPPSMNGNAFASTSTAQYPQILPQQQTYPPPTTFSSGAAPLQSPSRKRKASIQPLQEDPNSYRLLPPWAIPPAGELPGYGADRLSPFDYRLKGHTLIGSEGGGEKETVVLAPSYCLRDRQVGFKVTNRLPEGEVPKRGMERVLEVPEVRSFGRLNVEDSEMKDTLEFRNLNQGEREFESLSLLG